MIWWEKYHDWSCLANYAQLRRTLRLNDTLPISKAFLDLISRTKLAMNCDCSQETIMAFPLCSSVFCKKGKTGEFYLSLFMAYSPPLLARGNTQTTPFRKSKVGRRWRTLYMRLSRLFHWSGGWKSLKVFHQMTPFAWFLRGQCGTILLQIVARLQNASNQLSAHIINLGWFYSCPKSLFNFFFFFTYRGLEFWNLSTSCNVLRSHVLDRCETGFGRRVHVWCCSLCSKGRKGSLCECSDAQKIRATERAREWEWERESEISLIFSKQLVNDSNSMKKVEHLAPFP